MSVESVPRATTKALELGPCSEEDMLRYFTIVSEGFALEHEYFNMVFPYHNTPEGRQKGAQRLLAIMKNDSTATFLKVTDSATGEIIGAAKWNVYKDVIPPETGLGTEEYWESPELARYADALFKEYLAPRRQAIRESRGHLVCLDLLAVDPKHHYRGAGRMLVEWGTKVADELNYEAVVEASLQGRHLYELCGFQKQRFVTLHAPDEFDHLAEGRKQRYFWMVRPKRA